MRQRTAEYRILSGNKAAVLGGEIVRIYGKRDLLPLIFGLKRVVFDREASEVYMRCGNGNGVGAEGIVLLAVLMDLLGVVVIDDDRTPISSLRR